MVETLDNFFANISVEIERKHNYMILVFLRAGFGTETERYRSALSFILLLHPQQTFTIKWFNESLVKLPKQSRYDCDCVSSLPAVSDSPFISLRLRKDTPPCFRIYAT